MTIKAWLLEYPDGKQVIDYRARPHSWWLYKWRKEFRGVKRRMVVYTAHQSTMRNCLVCGHSLELHLGREPCES